jgi:hypothetical protein
VRLKGETKQFIWGDDPISGSQSEMATRSLCSLGLTGRGSHAPNAGGGWWRTVTVLSRLCVALMFPRARRVRIESRNRLIGLIVVNGN